MTTEKQWFAVYTKPRCEKKVTELLTRKKIENYCPLNRTVRQWSDRKKTISEPLFASYVFVCAMPQEHTEIRQTEGVVNFVYWLGTPAVIRTEEIIAVKKFVQTHVDIMLEKIPVGLHDKVRITDGLLVNLEGSVVEMKTKTVKIFLPSLGYAIAAEVQKTKVERLTHNQNVFPSASYYNAKAV